LISAGAEGRRKKEHRNYEMGGILKKGFGGRVNQNKKKELRRNLEEKRNNERRCLVSFMGQRNARTTNTIS